MNTQAPLLQIDDLRVSSLEAHRTLDIVRGISFSLFPHQTLALVGESGSGKTMTAHALIRLFRQESIRITGGQIFFNDENLLQKSEKEMQAIRGKEIAFVSQNPLNSLNPSLQIGTQLLESIKPDTPLSKHALYERCYEMLHLVGFSDCKKRFSSYPSELSGGMRQRLLIAMALINHPKILIADEPTTALDVTIQAQILDLLLSLQEKMGMSILFITHDLGVVAKIAHDVCVMYSGKIVERADVNTIFYEPKHPYTQALLKCLPRIDSEKKETLTPIRGAPPQVGKFTGMCPFLPRCADCMQICSEKEPELNAVDEKHLVSCHKIAAAKKKDTSNILYDDLVVQIAAKNTTERLL